MSKKSKSESTAKQGGETTRRQNAADVVCVKCDGPMLVIKSERIRFESNIVRQRTYRCTECGRTAQNCRELPEKV